MQRLSAAGLVTTTNGLIVATEAGVDALGPEFELLPTGDALLEHWLARLPQGERIILDVVVAEWPDWLSRQAISGATLYKRSSRDTYIQRLRARNLVTTSPEGIRASDELFDRVGCRRG